MNDMRITATIMTSEESFHNNYGAALQGYAIYSVIHDLGIYPTIVRYQGGQFQNSSAKYYLFRAKRRLGAVVHCMLPSHAEKESRLLKKENAEAIKKREELFIAFQNEMMSFYNIRRMTWQQLKKHYPLTDVYICGSDQIWNPYFKNGRNDPGYFLAFAPKGAKKIAYAPSFGCDDLPDSAKANLKELLSDFHAISVREQSGVEIVKKYADRVAQWVLDPTMLRKPEQWKQLSRLPSNLPEKYILSYRFADSGKTKRMLDQLSEATGLPVITLPLSIVAMKDNYQAIFEAGPREFIGMIEHASLVCTDSFHATVFSVLMKTPVCVFLRESYDGKSSMNSRVYSLLEMLNLQNNIMNEDATVAKALKCLETDYTSAHELLADYRKESLEYLKNALEG